MDAGLAAVLGALSGSIATIGSAWATGRTQREGARIAVRAEHRRERREPRHNVYKEIIAEASRMRSKVGVFSVDVNMDPPDVNTELVQDWYQQADVIKEKVPNVALAGPREVTEAVLFLEGVATALPATLEAYIRALDLNGAEKTRVRKTIREFLRDESRDFEKAYIDLVGKAQAALDDDGSR